MANCPHGQIGPHGDHEKGDWCAGPLGRMAEPWRQNLEFQMNATPLWKNLTVPLVPFERFADKGAPSAEGLMTYSDVVIGADVGRDSITTVTATVDRLSDWEPVYYIVGAHVGFYDVPIYYSVVEDLGFDPANPVDRDVNLDA